MKKYHVILVLLCLGMLPAAGQQTKPDSAAVKTVNSDTEDSLEDYDELLDELGDFLDSLLRPRSFFLVNIAASKGYYNYKGNGLTRIQTEAANNYSPMLAYYHKTGPGIALAGFMMNDRGKLNLYQYSITPSYDYLSNLDFATGISYTRYISKDSLAFYVSPLQNELSAYFTYRKYWLKPSVSINYGWGNRDELNLRLGFIQRLRLRKRVLNFLQSNYDRSVNDISVTTSVLHDFFWLEVFSKKDNIRVTPQLIFTSGTQQFGFNQRVNNYTLGKISRGNLLSTAREFKLDNRKEFKPLSLAFSLRTEYSFGKFYIQPQLLVDYYFPADADQLTTLFSLNAGLNF